MNDAQAPPANRLCCAKPRKGQRYRSNIKGFWAVPSVAPWYSAEVSTFWRVTSRWSPTRTTGDGSGNDCSATFGREDRS